MPAPIRPTTLAELEPAERLIVWSFRRWVADACHHPLVRHEFARQMAPPGAARALLAFERLIEAIRRAARRTIHYHQPCCPCLGGDEVCLMTLVTAAQLGDDELAAATARWLVRDGGVPELLAAAHELADILLGHGLCLPRRVGGAAAPSEVAAASGRILLH